MEESIFLSYLKAKPLHEYYHAIIKYEESLNKEYNDEGHPPHYQEHLESIQEASSTKDFIKSNSILRRTTIKENSP